MEDNVKTCTTCGKPKLLTSFGKKLSGLKSACRECLNNNHKIWRKENPEYHSEWRKKNPRHHYEWKLKHPLQLKAWRLVDNEIASGRLQRMPCFVCGDKKSEAHHEDYKKPLSITWLCRGHHYDRHKELNIM